ncbi:MAG: zinc ribbon domain-containing protein [bacterium]
MKYLTICNNCKYKSDAEERTCPNCGVEKPENTASEGLADTIVRELSVKINFVDNPEIYVRLFLRILLFAAGVLFIPKFISESEIFIIGLYIYAVLGVIKEFERRIIRIKGIYLISKFLIAAYIGSGAGNLLTYTGTYHGYKLGYFFNPGFLMNEISGGNFLIFLGMISGLGLFGISIYFASLLKENKSE